VPKVKNKAKEVKEPFGLRTEMTISLNSQFIFGYLLLDM